VSSRVTLNFFPTAQARYEIEPDLIARRRSRRPSHPDSSKSRPRRRSTRAAANITTGNPDLKPTRDRFDLSIEQYLPHAASHRWILRENIKDYIVQNVQQTAGGRRTRRKSRIVKSSARNASTCISSASKLITCRLQRHFAGPWRTRVSPTDLVQSKYKFGR